MKTLKDSSQAQFYCWTEFFLHHLSATFQLHPYKAAVVHQLLLVDFEHCLEYCIFFNYNLNDDNLLDLTFFTDSIVSPQRLWKSTELNWSTGNAHVFACIHSQKIGMQYAMSRRRIIGPIFLRHYKCTKLLLTNIETIHYKLHDDELRHGFFQPEGGTAHTA